MAPHPCVLPQSIAYRTTNTPALPSGLFQAAHAAYTSRRQPSATIANIDSSIQARLAFFFRECVHFLPRAFCPLANSTIAHQQQHSPLGFHPPRLPPIAVGAVWTSECLPSCVSTREQERASVCRTDASRVNCGRESESETGHVKRERGREDNVCVRYSRPCSRTTTIVISVICCYRS